MFESLKETAQIAAILSTAISIILAVIRYYTTTRSEQQAREYGTYNALDDKYLEFQKLCLRHPYLDVFDVPDRKPAVLDELQKKQELIAFTMLIAIFERAYLMYFGHSEGIKQRQWSGWDEYMRLFCGRTNFRENWTILGHQFDTNFVGFMNGILAGDGGKP